MASKPRINWICIYFAKNQVNAPLSLLFSFITLCIQMGNKQLSILLLLLSQLLTNLSPPLFPLALRGVHRISGIAFAPYVKFLAP